MDRKAWEIVKRRGRRGVLVHKDSLDRKEKDVVREAYGPEGTGGYWFVEPPEIKE
jgi:hypothetical protein